VRIAINFFTRAATGLINCTQSLQLTTQQLPATQQISSAITHGKEIPVNFTLPNNTYMWLPEIKITDMSDTKKDLY